MRRAVISVLLAIAAAPATAAEPASAPPAAMDRWIVALRCRERPTIEAQMACYGMAARLAAEGAWPGGAEAWAARPDPLRSLAMRAWRRDSADAEAASRPGCAGEGNFRGGFSGGGDVGPSSDPQRTSTLSPPLTRTRLAIQANVVATVPVAATVPQSNIRNPLA